MPNRKTRPQHELSSRARRSAGVVITSLTSLLICISAAQAASKRVIWERGDQIVQLGRQDDVAALPNDHPAKTAANDIEAMLDALRLRRAGDDSGAAAVSVFTQDEIDNLGKAVATALARATPSQDVFFHVIGAHRLSRGAFARRNRVTAGRMFYRDGNLNIIFGQVQTPHRKKNIYGQTDQDFHPRNYGSRTKMAEHEVVLLANNATQLYQAEGGVRADWLVMQPPGDTIAGPTPNQPSSPIIAPAVTPAVTPAVADREERPIPPAIDSETTNGQPSDVSVVPAAPLPTDVESRLKALKSLRDKKLISEDAYEAKMNEILQDL